MFDAVIPSFKFMTAHPFKPEVEHLMEGSEEFESFPEPSAAGSGTPSGLAEGVAVVALGRGPGQPRPADAVAAGGTARSLRLLLVEDDPEEADLTRRLLLRAQRARYEVDRVGTAEEGLQRLAEGAYDVCLADLYLPGRDGLAFLRTLRARDVQIPVVLYSGYADEEMESLAIDLGAADFLDKEELDTARLDRSLRFAIARSRDLARLDRLAQYDELTGLANRALFRDRLDKALAAARRHRSLVGVVLLDLNGFKAVNDRLGHGAGDALLREVGERLRRSLRETDTVARLGGDEFAVVVEDLRRAEDAAIVGRKILDAVAPAFAFDGEPVCITASIGMALYPRDGETAEQLVERADAAMYRAKREGGNLCRFHDSALDREIARGPVLAAELQAAIAADELALLFQPQVTLAPGPVGLATIVRWDHPGYGEVEAEDFRALAERAGLMEELTDWLIRAACAQARRWVSQGFGPLHLAVPIYSRRQLAWSGLAERVEEQCRLHGIPPAALELEIEEQLLLEELLAGGAAFDSLRRSRVRIAVARFGAGPTSLMVLRDAPVHTLKLARELIHDTPRDEHRTLFVSSIVELARTLRLRLVAEGIENKAQLQMLRRAGCDAVQAIISCPPLPERDATAWLRRAQQRQRRR